jgi:transposase
VVLAEDETHIDLLARLRSCWIPTGLRHRILTPGTNGRRTVHGAANLLTGAVHHHVSVKNVSVVFCYFLQQLLDAYPTAATITVICDNGSTHHSKTTQRRLAENPRIQIIEDPKYSPPDNPVERIWAAMKRQLANTFAATITDRVHQAHAFFQHRTNTQNLTTAAPCSTSPWLPQGYGKEFWPGLRESWGISPLQHEMADQVTENVRPSRETQSPSRTRRPVSVRGDTVGRGGWQPGCGTARPGWKLAAEVGARRPECGRGSDAGACAHQPNPAGDPRPTGPRAAEAPRGSSPGAELVTSWRSGPGWRLAGRAAAGW